MYQLSVDQSFPEENSRIDERSNEIETLAQLHEEVENQPSITAEVVAALPSMPKADDVDAIVEAAAMVKRPNSLMLNCIRSEFDNNGISGGLPISKKRKQHRYLYRSNSSSLHKRPTSLVPISSAANNNKYKLSSELDQIYFISSNKDDDNYDSIEVIDERRMKNLPKSEKARLYKSNTFICEEYYTSTPAPQPASTESQAKCDNERITTTTTAVVEMSVQDDTATGAPVVGEAAEDASAEPAITMTTVDAANNHAEKQ